MIRHLAWDCHGSLGGCRHHHGKWSGLGILLLIVLAIGIWDLH